MEEKGESSQEGDSSCTLCDLGKHQSTPGVCTTCAAGRYQDGKGATECISCEKDSYFPNIGATAKSQCQKCTDDRTTGDKEGTTSSTSCLCKRDQYYQNNTDCLPCPIGANCSKSDGITLVELFAQPGYWRNSPYSDTFSPCNKGYRGLSADSIAKKRCCPGSICKNLDMTSNTNINLQCLRGYAGPLCLICADQYVKMGGKCVSCKGGASIAIAIIPLLITTVLLFIIVLLYLYCSTKTPTTTPDRTQSVVTLENARKIKKVNKFFGQVKILLSFFQIFSSMPSILDSVPWPDIVLEFSIPFNIFNMDFIALLSRTSCGVAVRFFDRFLLHMILPFLCLVGVGAAFVCARACCIKKTQRLKRDIINQEASMVMILIVLLLFPGLATKIFQMFKCQEIEGIQGELLVQDYAITCHQGEHLEYSIIAGAFLFLYIGGIPVTIFLLLFRSRKHLHDHTSKRHIAKKALSGLYQQYEPQYWWFELMVLFNKTLMCGGLVVLAPGSPYQILAAILIMTFHLLVVLKLAPYVKDSEDWSSVISTLGLCFMSLGAYSMLIQANEDEVEFIGTVLVGISITCITSVILIMIFIDCGLWNRMFGRKKRNTNENTSMTQVQPINIIENRSDEIDAGIVNTSSTINRNILPQTALQKKEKSLEVKYWN